MNINKAIKKQKFRYNIFKLAMLFIFIFLPLSLLLLKSIHIIIIIYLCIIEMLILISLAYVKNGDYLEFKIDNVAVKIKWGFPIRDVTLFSEKIVLVHADGKDKNIDVILISKVKLRNKIMKNIDDVFLENYPLVAEQFNRIRKVNPQNDYFYFIIKSGGYKKFVFLDELYKCSTSAFYTKETISEIKLYRNSK
jgi:hypothetical protein